MSHIETAERIVFDYKSDEGSLAKLENAITAALEKAEADAVPTLKAQGLVWFAPPKGSILTDDGRVLKVLGSEGGFQLAEEDGGERYWKWWICGAALSAKEQ